MFKYPCIMCSSCHLIYYAFIFYSVKINYQTLAETIRTVTSYQREVYFSKYKCISDKYQQLTSTISIDVRHGSYRKIGTRVMRMPTKLVTIKYCALPLILLVNPQKRFAGFQTTNFHDLSLSYFFFHVRILSFSCNLLLDRKSYIIPTKIVGLHSGAQLG